MARVTIEDCLTKVNSMYELVHIATQRTRQYTNGSQPLVPSKNRFAVTALREIAAGVVRAVPQDAQSQVDDDDHSDLLSN